MIDRDSILGKRFGRLVVKDFEVVKGKGLKVLCECDCGNTCTPEWGDVNKGRTLSCGCLQRERRFGWV